MKNSANDKKMQTLFDRFMGSFIENRDPRIDLEIDALTQLKGMYLEKAKTTILERLEKSPDRDAIWSARAINLTEAIPLIQRWLGEIRSNPTGKYSHPYSRGLLAYNLYEFTKDESYIPDVVETVQKEGYSDFDYGVSWLRQMPLTMDGISAVWQKYKRGKTIKDPNSWRECCADFLREKIKEPIGQNFFNSLPEDEKRELLELTGESYHQRLERKFRLERYIYGRERYSKEDVNRYDEYIKVGGSPVKGMTLKQLWEGHIGEIQGLKWSPDGRYLASYASDDTLRIWSLDSGHTVKVLKREKEYQYAHHKPQRVVWTSVSGERIAVNYSNGQRTPRDDKYDISEWSVVTEKLGASLYGTSDQLPMNDLLYLFDQETFLLCYWNALYLFDRATRRKKRILEEYKGRWGSVSLSSNGKVAAIGYHELKDPKTGVEYYHEGVSHEILVYEIGSEKVVGRFNTGHIQGINRLCWMPGKPVLALASSDNSISILDLKENKRLALLESEGFVGSITGLTFSANGILLASESHGDGLLRIWRTDKWEEVIALRAISSYGSNFSFHPSLPMFASICSLREADDNSSDDSRMGICIWEFDYETFLSNPPFMEEFKRREADIRAKLLREEITEDLEYIKVDGSPVKGFKLRHVFTGHTDRIHEISWSPNGHYLASPSDDKTVRIWDEETGECVATLAEQDEIKHSAWSPTGQSLVYGENKQIKLWNMESRESINLLQDDFRRLDSLTFSPDGKRVALAYGYNMIQIVDTQTWKEVNRKVCGESANWQIKLQWSVDGSQILANLNLGIIEFLDARTLELVKSITIPGEHDKLYGISFLFAWFQDKIAVAEEKKPIYIFDVHSGQLDKEFSEAVSYVSGLSFSPDGKILLAWCQDDSVYFWRTDTWQRVAKIHEYATRAMSPAYPCFHPTKPSLITFCDKRKSMRLWDIDYKDLLG